MTWQPRTLGDLLSERSLPEREGRREALVTPTARLTYGELAEKSKVAAGAMQALGIGKGDRVAILMPNGEQWLALFYGAALIGAVTVPVNTRFKAAEIDFCLKQSGARALFYVGRFPNNDYGAMVREIDFRWAFDVSRNALPVQELKGVSVDPGDLLLIQFTSGTTARPKGVMLMHDNMLRNAWAAGSRIDVRAEDRCFNCRPFFHVGGSTLSALMALVFGCCLVTLPTFEAGAALEMLERERCTLTSGNDTIFMRGYCNDLEATTRAFTGDGWLRTGDLGELAADGRLRMVGRLKDVFRVGGENVSPAEVEEVLLAHPAVEAAQVIGVPDARLGEVACAYVTLKAGYSASEEEILAFARRKSANFRVPRYLRVIADFESIGMTASGKAQKAKLRERALKEFGL